MNIAEILRKLADVVDGKTTGEEETTVTNRPGMHAELTDAPGAKNQEDPDIINVEPMVPPLQQKLELLKHIAGVEDEECETCHQLPCACTDSEDEMSIMKRNAGLAPFVAFVADEDEPFES